MTYTVIGVWLDDKPVVVGVVAGSHEVYGGDEQTFPEGLWATAVNTADVEQAEHAAKTHIAENTI